ncbi:MAG TPA: 2-alkenal reductase [Armatimonadetes bacterium]|nr:2-alkenal reductase [Armatimonadota bacterium]
MKRFNARDLVAGLIIMFLLGLLAGNYWQRGGPAPAAPRAEAPVVTPEATAALREMGDSFAAIAAAATPAVVNISTTATIRGRSFADPLLQYFYGERDRTSQSLGSGVIVDPDGIVVTNNHVVSVGPPGAAEVEVTVSLADGRTFPANIVGTDPESDIAVLKINGPNLPFVAWGEAEPLRVGDWVVAIGNPYGLSSTVTSGIVSGKGRSDLGLSQFEDFLQTDAAINSGNSGGALLDLEGRLVGINTAIFSESGGSQGIGFAIPAEMAKANAEQILTTGTVVRGWIGVIPQPVTDRMATALGLPDTRGAILVDFSEGDPALAAGLQQGDVVVAVNDQPIKDPGELRSTIAQQKPGEQAQLRIYRNGRERTVAVRIVQRPVGARGQPKLGT